MWKDNNWDKYRVRLRRWSFRWSLLSALLLVGVAQADDYVAGFFTRGSDTGIYVDTGNAEYDLFYIPIERFSVLPRITLVATYEDNLFLDAESASDGMVVYVVPGVIAMLGRPEGRNVYLDYGMIIPLYDSSDELQTRLSHMVTLGGVYRTSRTQIDGRVGYRRLEDIDSLIGARIRKEDLIAMLGVEYEVSTKSSVGALAQLEQHRFESDAFIDYDRYYAALRLYHALTARSQAFVQAGIGHDDLAQGEYGDADFYDVSLGMRGKPTVRSIVSGRVGYMWRTYDDGPRDIEHWIASLYGEVNPYGFTTFSSELRADIRPTINQRGGASIDQRWTVGVHRRIIWDRLRGSASAFLGRTDYRSPTLREDVSTADRVYDRRRDEYWGYSLGLDYWAKYNLSAGIAYSYVENRAARNADSLIRSVSSYDAGRWVARVSWNY